MRALLPYDATILARMASGPVWHFENPSPEWDAINRLHQRGLLYETPSGIEGGRAIFTFTINALGRTALCCYLATASMNAPQ
jgi:hypothetical protein